MPPPLPLPHNKRNTYAFEEVAMDEVKQGEALEEDHSTLLHNIEYYVEQLRLQVERHAHELKKSHVTLDDVLGHTDEVDGRLQQQTHRMKTISERCNVPLWTNVALGFLLLLQLLLIVFGRR